MDYLKKIKKILNQCTAKNWIGRSSFTGFKMSVNDTPKTFLMEDELVAITSKKISIQRLEQVRDIFLFSCYTGLAYCDVAKLTPDDVVMGSMVISGFLLVGQKRKPNPKFRCSRFQARSY
jgi:hypothetical protein